MTRYVFDSYAVIEMLEGNHHYAKYTVQGGILNDFIVAELSYHFLRIYGQRTAELYTRKYAQHSMKLTTDVIFKAAMFRFKHKKKKLSMTDCIGYMQAQSLGLKFLTGDKEFENIDGVEFVK